MKNNKITYLSTALLCFFLSTTAQAGSISFDWDDRDPIQSESQNSREPLSEESISEKLIQMIGNAYYAEQVDTSEKQVDSSERSASEGEVVAETNDDFQAEFLLPSVEQTEAQIESQVTKSEIQEITELALGEQASSSAGGSTRSTGGSTSEQSSSSAPQGGGGVGALSSDIQGVSDSLSDILSDIEPDTFSPTDIEDDILTLEKPDFRPTNDRQGDDVLEPVGLEREPNSGDVPTREGDNEPVTEVASIPEPTLVSLLSVGLLGLGVFSNRRRFFSSVR